MRLNLLVLFSAGLLFWSALAAMLPTLPLYVEETGANSITIGIVMGSFAIGLLSSRSWLAYLADYRGRKLVMVIGMVAVAIAPVLYLLTESVPLLIGIRAFHGLSIAAFALAYSALVIDLSPPQQRGELIGYMSLVNPVGMALGPAVGGFLHEWAGYLPAFLVASGLGFLGLVFTLRVQEPRLPDQMTVTAVAKPRPHFWRLLVTSPIRIPATVLLLIGLAFGTLSTFVPLFVQEAGVALNVGLFYTAAAIASFAIRLLVGRASDQRGRGLFITVSLILYTLSMAVLWIATSAPAFLLAAIFEGAGAGILIPMMAALMADRSHPNERGRNFSLCMAGFDLGIAIAGPIFGAIAIQTGYRTTFGLCAGLAFLGLLVFLTLSSKDLPHSLRFALGRGRDIYAVERLGFNS
ncbi:MFS transporter [Oscillatoria sp. FACHB-1407]|uniref:MFS transporter n=1 Tax=Oscillatoria sp. FACHB-1407 TaxID=2692847 RepID=UPI0028164398|nr:MFS transporter [Oscillatoria sp. FACHB-1407]